MGDLWRDNHRRVFGGIEGQVDGFNDRDQPRCGV